MKREAPFSLRLPPDLRGDLQAFADENGMKLHPVCLIMLREGLAATRLHEAIRRETMDRAGTAVADRRQEGFPRPTEVLPPAVAPAREDE